MSDLAKNHERIWLGPLCQTEERSWCSTPQDCDCDDAGCGLKAIEYVRADIAAAEIDRLRVNIDALSGVLEVHCCNNRPEKTVGECIKAGLCACSCEWLIEPERSAA